MWISRHAKTSLIFVDIICATLKGSSIHVLLQLCSCVGYLFFCVAYLLFYDRVETAREKKGKKERRTKIKGHKKDTDTIRNHCLCKFVLI